jgi:hypothetical protein
MSPVQIYHTHTVTSYRKIGAKRRRYFRLEEASLKSLVSYVGLHFPNRFKVLPRNSLIAKKVVTNKNVGQNSIALYFQELLKYTQPPQFMSILKCSFFQISYPSWIKIIPHENDAETRSCKKINFWLSKIFD